MLIHRLGRTSLDFSSGGVNHTFLIGELQGEEVPGMAMRSAPRCLAEDTMLQLGETTQKLTGVRDQIATLKVDPSQRDTKPTFSVNTANLKDVLDNLTTLTQSLAHPNLASPNLEWNTEMRLKKLLVDAHPQCPGQQDKRNWKISNVSGKCTEERLANTKPTVTCPKSLTLISQLKLPELIDEHASKGTLLVVICLAAYAKEQSNYAKLLAEKANAELWKRFRENDSGPPPVRLVCIELTEAGGFADQYGIKEVPYCLMFHGGHLAHSKKLNGMRLAYGDGGIAVRPRVLLVEPNPSQQLKLERNLRRNGYSSDLALDAPSALRLASRGNQAYGILLVSSLLHGEQLRSAAAAVRRGESGALVLAFNACADMSDEDAEARKRFLDECNYVFPYVPSYTGIAAVLARFEVNSRISKPPTGATSHKQNFLDDVLGVLGRGRPGGGGGATVGAEESP